MPSEPQKQEEQQKKNKNLQPKLPLSILESSVASVGALVASHPFELTKCRLQLQGELKSKAETLASGELRYNGTFDCLKKIAQREGIFTGIYRGFTFGACHQATMNGSRLGLYPIAKARCEELCGVQEESIFINAFVGFFVGMFSSIFGNVFGILKTRTQTSSTVAANQVGKQYHHYAQDGLSSSFLGQLKALHREKVVPSSTFSFLTGSGWFNGAKTASFRTATGSCSQLVAYDFAFSKLVKKERVVDEEEQGKESSSSSSRSFSSFEGFHKDDFRLHVLCALVAAVSITACMNPLDTLASRSYVDPGKKNREDSNVFRALQQIVRKEGISGLYKGSVALTARTLPQSVCTFTLLGQIKKRREETTAVAFPFLFK